MLGKKPEFVDSGLGLSSDEQDRSLVFWDQNKIFSIVLADIPSPRLNRIIIPTVINTASIKNLPKNVVRKFDEVARSSWSSELLFD